MESSLAASNMPLDCARSRKVKQLNEDLQEIRVKLHELRDLPFSPKDNTRPMLDTVVLGWKLVYERDVLLEELRIEKVIREEAQSRIAAKKNQLMDEGDSLCSTSNGSANSGTDAGGMIEHIDEDCGTCPYCQNLRNEIKKEQRLLDTNQVDDDENETTWAMHILGETQNDVNNRIVGMKKDVDLGLKILQHAAGKGNEFAQSKLGQEFYVGKNTARSYQTAFRWFKRAAEKGNASAYFHLGLCYHNGKGTNKNIDMAMRMYSLAAAQCYPLSGIHCSFIYSSLKNDNLAYYWTVQEAEWLLSIFQDDSEKD
jgi:hypothetical protein